MLTAITCLLFSFRYNFFYDQRNWKIITLARGSVFQHCESCVLLALAHRDFQIETIKNMFLEMCLMLFMAGQHCQHSSFNKDIFFSMKTYFNVFLHYSCILEILLFLYCVTDGHCSLRGFHKTLQLFYIWHICVHVQIFKYIYIFSLELFIYNYAL